MAIQHAQNYSTLLDEVYAKESLSAILDKPDVEFVGADTVNIPDIELDGLGDYDRSSGFVSGGATLTYTPYQLTQDRGRSFTIDAVDDEETNEVAIAGVTSQYVRTKVVPEVDAYSFAKIAGTSNVTVVSADITPGTTDVEALVDTASEALDDNAVPAEGRILFVSNKAYKGLKANIERTVMNGDGNISREVDTYNGAIVVRVPKTRFYSAITQLTGASGQTAGGYTKASGAKEINFILCHGDAIMKVAKHVKERLFTPDENQQADAFKYDYRIVYDTFVKKNKLGGVYVHISSTNAS